ncbi:hypothetical protein Mapa_005638 [Marchantia paleacea]|nr:hypothetical protein Mapa_005638 [Marchantia paleacea]
MASLRFFFSPSRTGLFFRSARNIKTRHPYVRVMTSQGQSLNRNCFESRLLSSP